MPKTKLDLSKIDAPARLELQGVSVSYDGMPALRDVSFKVSEGARVAVIGPNGAGKSTLFKTLVGLLPVNKGRILIHDLPLGVHDECVAYVPQREEVDWHFPVTVQDVVMMGRFRRMGWLKRPSKGDQEAVQASLEQMGILPLAGRPISELSGGQQQRVFLARALAQEPHMLLMDEPFNGVDISTQEAILHLLDELKLKQVTIMIATHDLRLASGSFDYVLLLNHQVIAYGAPEQVLTPDNLSRAFSGQLLVLPGNQVVLDECCQPEEEAQHDHTQEGPR